MTIVSKVTEITVIESPDGSKTVYCRTGNGPRTKIPYSHFIEADIEAEVAKENLRQKWADILEEADSNPALQESVNQCIMVYDLTRRDKETTAHHPV